jgi:hypothetical protein
MSDYAYDLVWRFSLHQRSGVDEHAPADNKGIERIVVDKNDLDVPVGQTCCLEDRLGVITNESFYLRIANDRDPVAGLRIGGGRNYDQQKRQQNPQHHGSGADAVPEIQDFGSVLHGMSLVNDQNVLRKAMLTTS